MTLWLRGAAIRGCMLWNRIDACCEVHRRRLGHLLIRGNDGRQLSGEFAAEEAAAYLSGLLVASDVHGALDVLCGSVRPAAMTPRR